MRPARARLRPLPVDRTHLRAVEALFGELRHGVREYVGAPQPELALSPLFARRMRFRR